MQNAPLPRILMRSWGRALNNKVMQAVAIGVALVGLALVPVAMLDLVRWAAIVAIALYAALRYYRSEPAVAVVAPGKSPNRTAPLSAVLMVSVTAPLGRPFDEREWQLFRGAIMQCIRGGDRVTSPSSGLYSVVLRDVTPDMAEKIGQRICDQLKDLIVFDDSGAIKAINVGVGGVTSFSGSDEDGQIIAGANLKKLKSMNGVGILMSMAA